MRKEKKKRLAAKGWKIGNAKDFLGLSEAESAYIELKIRLAEALRQRRQGKGLSQVDLAAKLESSQSRIAKMEAGDPSVSLDLLIRSLITLGASDRNCPRSSLIVSFDSVNDLNGLNCWNEWNKCWSDALRPGTRVAWAKNSKSPHT